MSEVLPATAAAIARAATLLRDGKLVAFPTETVYGLGANALDAAAVQRIFEAKGRPAYNPIIVHVPDTAAARALAATWPADAERLAAAYWPGPLTLVVPKRSAVPDIVTAGRPAVALRVPSHPVALELLNASGVPIAAPSANRSNEVSPTTAQHVAKSLGDRVGLILDGGATDVGIESTVVDLTGDQPVLLRPGLIDADALARVVGPLRRASTPATAGEPRLSPGLLERHYAPRAELRHAGTLEQARALLTHASAGARIGALLRTWTELPADHVIRLPNDPAAYSHGLYASLHALDELGCTLVVVEAVPDGHAWDGIRDRLTRAATPQAPGPTG